MLQNSDYSEKPWLPSLSYITLNSVLCSILVCFFFFSFRLIVCIPSDMTHSYPFNLFHPFLYYLFQFTPSLFSLLSLLSQFSPTSVCIFLSFCFFPILLFCSPNKTQFIFLMFYKRQPKMTMSYCDSYCHHELDYITFLFRT